MNNLINFDAYLGKFTINSENNIGENVNKILGFQIIFFESYNDLYQKYIQNYIFNSDISERLSLIKKGKTSGHSVIAFLDNKKIIGLVEFKKKGNQLYVEYISSDKNNLNRGISKILLENLFKYASKNNFTIIASQFTSDGIKYVLNNMYTLSQKYNVLFIDQIPYA